MALTDIVTVGHAPGDDHRTKQLKSVTFLVVVGVIGTVSWNLLFGVERSPFHLAIEVTAVVLALGTVVAFGVTRDLEPGWWIFVPGFMLIEVFVMVLIGTVEGDFATFFIVPAAAVVILGPERSTLWFWLSVLAILTIPALDSLLGGVSLPMLATSDNPTGTISGNSIAINEAMPLAAAVFFGWFLTRSGYLELEKAKDVIEVQRAELEIAHARSETLLANMLPQAVAERLKDESTITIADDFEEITVMFVDIVGFTPMAAEMSAAETVNLLNRAFTQWDELAARRGLEKIKTIGDAYMVAGGLPEARPDHAVSIAYLAIDILEATDQLRHDLEVDLHVRIGINSGPAVAGVIGTRKPFYDVWGDTVNMAARMETHGITDRIQVTEASHRLLADEFEFTDAGLVDVRGRGPTRTFHLIGPRSRT